MNSEAIDKPDVTAAAEPAKQGEVWGEYWPELAQKLARQGVVVVSGRKFTLEYDHDPLSNMTYLHVQTEGPGVFKASFDFAPSLKLMSRWVPTASAPFEVHVALHSTPKDATSATSLDDVVDSVHISDSPKVVMAKLFKFIKSKLAEHEVAVAAAEPETDKSVVWRDHWNALVPKIARAGHARSGNRTYTLKDIHDPDSSSTHYLQLIVEVPGGFRQYFLCSPSSTVMSWGLKTEGTYVSVRYNIDGGSYRSANGTVQVNSTDVPARVLAKLVHFADDVINESSATAAAESEATSNTPQAWMNFLALLGKVTIKHKGLVAQANLFNHHSDGILVIAGTYGPKHFHAMLSLLPRDRGPHKAFSLELHITTVLKFARSPDAVTSDEIFDVVISAHDTKKMMLAKSVSVLMKFFESAGVSAEAATEAELPTAQLIERRFQELASALKKPRRIQGLWLWSYYPFSSSTEGVRIHVSNAAAPIQHARPTDSHFDLSAPWRMARSVEYSVGNGDNRRAVSTDGVKTSKDLLVVLVRFFKELSSPHVEAAAETQAKNVDVRALLLAFKEQRKVGGFWIRSKASLTGDAAVLTMSTVKLKLGGYLGEISYMFKFVDGKHVVVRVIGVDAKDAAIIDIDKADTTSELLRILLGDFVKNKHRCLKHPSAHAAAEPATSNPMSMLVLAQHFQTAKRVRGVWLHSCDSMTNTGHVIRLRAASEKSKLLGSNIVYSIATGGGADSPFYYAERVSKFNREPVIVQGRPTAALVLRHIIDDFIKRLPGDVHAAAEQEAPKTRNNWQESAITFLYKATHQQGWCDLGTVNIAGQRVPVSIYREYGGFFMSFGKLYSSKVFFFAPAHDDRYMRFGENAGTGLVGEVYNITPAADTPHEFGKWLLKNAATLVAMGTRRGLVRAAAEPEARGRHRISNTAEKNSADAFKAISKYLNTDNALYGWDVAGYHVELLGEPRESEILVTISGHGLVDDSFVAVFDDSAHGTGVTWRLEQTRFQFPTQAVKPAQLLKEIIAFAIKRAQHPDFPGNPHGFAGAAAEPAPKDDVPEFFDVAAAPSLAFDRLMEWNKLPMQRSGDVKYPVSVPTRIKYSHTRDREFAFHDVVFRTSDFGDSVLWGTAGDTPKIHLKTKSPITPRALLKRMIDYAKELKSATAAAEPAAEPEFFETAVDPYLAFQALLKMPSLRAFKQDNRNLPFPARVPAVLIMDFTDTRRLLIGSTVFVGMNFGTGVFYDTPFSREEVWNVTPHFGLSQMRMPDKISPKRLLPLLTNFARRMHALAATEPEPNNTLQTLLAKHHGTKVFQITFKDQEYTLRVCFGTAGGPLSRNRIGIYVATTADAEKKLTHKVPWTQFELRQQNSTLELARTNAATYVVVASFNASFSDVDKLLKQVLLACLKHVSGATASAAAEHDTLDGTLEAIVEQFPTLHKISVGGYRMRIQGSHQRPGYPVLFVRVLPELEDVDAAEARGVDFHVGKRPYTEIYDVFRVSSQPVDRKIAEITAQPSTGDLLAVITSVCIKKLGGRIKAAASLDDILGLPAGSCKFNNGRVDVNGDVDLSNRGLTRFPYLFGRVRGSFNCSGNNLTSLAGSPLRVHKSFDCSHNNLTSLHGGPVSVGGDFDCNHNAIASLKGAPKHVSGTLDCSDNNVANLFASLNCRVLRCHNNKLRLDQAKPAGVETLDLGKQVSL